jgi:hypothetical protein
VRRVSAKRRLTASMTAEQIFDRRTAGSLRRARSIPSNSAWSNDESRQTWRSRPFRHLRLFNQERAFVTVNGENIVTETNLPSTNHDAGSREMAVPGS